MKRGQSEQRKAVRSYRRKPIKKPDGKLKFNNSFISRKAVYGSPVFLQGSNADKKRKTNKIEQKRRLKLKHKKNKKL